MLLAAIDLGSNSFRLEIARVEGNQIFSEGSWKETVRLAGGIDEEGKLTEAKQEKALAALSRIAEKLQGFPRQHVRAVGTQTLRAATNSAEFIRRAEEILDCKIEILRGKEEARLVFEGCSFALPVSDKTRLIVDIGGASTECVVGKGHEVMAGESFHVGCVNTSVRFFKGGRISEEQFTKAQLAAEAEFEGNIGTILSIGWDEAYGSSGTAGAVSWILHECGWTDGTITKEALTRLKTEILSSGEISKLRFPGLKDDRKEVIAGGVAVLLAVFNKLKIKSMKPAGGALRYGILHDLAGRKENRDPRTASVENLQKRFGASRVQAELVCEIAKELYGQIAPNATEEDKQKLFWACQLHEIGRVVSRSDYHKHSEYLIRNCDIPGFSKPEQEALASLVLSQRGNLKKVASLVVIRKSMLQVLCLRLATIIAHARIPLSDLPVKLTEKGRSILLVCAKDWLAKYPLTEFMLSQEEEIWAKVGYEFELIAL